MPPRPVQSRVKVVDVTKFLRISEAARLLLPPQAEPVHDVALVLDHVNVTDPLYTTKDALALNVMVGAGIILTVTDDVVLPPRPLHVML